MRHSLLAAALVLLAAPAAAQTSTAVASLGQTVRIGALRLKPIAVLEDSRCPQLVTCVWRGRLRITASVPGRGVLTLDNGVAVSVGRGRLTLVDAVPLSQRGEKIPPRAY